MLSDDRIMTIYKSAAASLADENPMMLVQLLRKLRRVRGSRSRLFARLLEARLHEIDTQRTKKEKKRK